MSMTVSKHRLVQYVFDHMEEIRWRMGESGGFAGKLGEALVHVGGSDLVRTYLVISADGESYSITEPQPLADAPLGRWIKSFRTKVLKQTLPPLNAETQAAIRLKNMMAAIVKYASAQVLQQFNDPQYERKLRRRIWNKMTGDLGL